MPHSYVGKNGATRAAAPQTASNKYPLLIRETFKHYIAIPKWTVRVFLVAAPALIPPSISISPSRVAGPGPKWCGRAALSLGSPRNDANLRYHYSVSERGPERPTPLASLLSQRLRLRLRLRLRPPIAHGLFLNVEDFCISLHVLFRISHGRVQNQTQTKLILIFWRIPKQWSSNGGFCY